MSNDINKIGVFGALSDFKARGIVSEEELNSIWEECASDGVVTKDELMGAVSDVVPEEELTTEDMEMISAIQGEEEIEEGAWNNWMDRATLDSNSVSNSEMNGAQGENNGLNSIIPTVTSANLEGSSSDLRARRSEDMAKLAELRSQKENNPAIAEAKANVESLKIAYDEALTLVEQEGGNEEIQRIQSLKADNDSEIANQNTIKSGLTLDISSTQGRINGLKGELAGLTKPQKESEEDPTYQDRLQAYETKKAQLEQQIRQEEDALSNLNQQLGTCEAKIQELENSNLDLDLQLETYLAEQDFEEGSALAKLQEALSAYNEAQISLRQIEQQQNAQIDANIAQLEQNLLSYDSAISNAEAEEGIENNQPTEFGSAGINGIEGASEGEAIQGSEDAEESTTATLEPATSAPASRESEEIEPTEVQEAEITEPLFNFPTITTQEELFETLGIQNNTLPNNADEISRYIWGQYQQTGDLEETIALANSYIETVNNYSSLQSTPGFNEVYESLFSEIDDNPFVLLDEMLKMAIDDLSDKLFTIEETNKTMDAIYSYCMQNNIPVPDEYIEYQDYLDESTNENIERYNYGSYLFDKVNQSGRYLESALETLGCEVGNIVYNDDNTIASIELLFDDGNGGKTSHVANFEGAQLNQTQTGAQGEEASIEAQYSTDGSYDTTTQDTTINSNELVITRLEMLTSMNPEELAYGERNLGEAQITLTLSNCRTIDDFYGALVQFTGGDKNAARIMFNAVFSDEAVISQLGVNTVSINESGNILINDAVVDGTQNNPLQDREDIVINSLFDYRNGEYVVSDTVLNAYSTQTYQYDDEGNLLSGTDYTIDSQGRLSANSFEYEYQDGVQVSRTTRDYDVQTGEVNYYEVSQLILDGDEIAVQVLRGTSETDMTETVMSIEEYNEMQRLQAIAKKYTDRTDLSFEELLQFETIDYLTQRNGNVKEILLTQDYEDGVITKGYNWVKEGTGWGTGRNEVADPMVDSNNAVLSLIEALNNPELSFEAAYLKAYGVEYNQSAIDNARLHEGVLQLYSSNQTQYALWEEQLRTLYQNGQIDECKELLSIIYPEGDFESIYSEFEAEQAFFSDIALLSDLCLYSNYSSYDEETLERANELSVLYPDMPRFEQFYDANEYQAAYEEFMLQRFCEFYGEEIGTQQFNLFKGNENNFEINTLPTVVRRNLSETLNNNIKAIGINPETLAQDYLTLSENAFGDGAQTEAMEIAQRYCMEQEKFISTCANIAKGAGTVLMVGGTIIAIGATGPAGAGIALGCIKAGQYMAVGGIFGEDILNFANEASSKNCSQREMEAIVYDGMMDIALYASGRMIGQISNGLNANIQSRLLGAGDPSKALVSQTSARLIGGTAEVIADASLSLAADYTITGKVDLTSEGFSQLLSILVGIGGSRIANINANFRSNAVEFDPARREVVSSSDINHQVGASQSRISIYNVASTPKVSAFDKFKALFTKTQSNIFEAPCRQRAPHDLDLSYSGLEANWRLPNNQRILIDGTESFNLSGYELDLQDPNIRSLLNNMQNGIEL